MKLDTVWVVRDPANTSAICDIVWEAEVSRLADYVVGAGPGVWEREHHTLYTDRDEALVDAIRRMIAADNDRDAILDLLIDVQGEWGVNLSEHFGTRDFFESGR